tara:strand:+ start:48 stop:317 length:270 start_codon:yes stop_codon:yes gene_type:complete
MNKQIIIVILAAMSFVSPAAAYTSSSYNQLQYNIREANTSTQLLQNDMSSINNNYYERNNLPNVELQDRMRDIQIQQEVLRHETQRLYE